jgi:hypothetical protein
MYLSLYASARSSPISSLPQCIVGRFCSSMRRPWKARKAFYLFSDCRQQVADPFLEAQARDGAPPPGPHMPKDLASHLPNNAQPLAPFTRGSLEKPLLTLWYTNTCLFKISWTRHDNKEVFREENNHHTTYLSYFWDSPFQSFSICMLL